VLLVRNYNLVHYLVISLISQHRSFKVRDILYKFKLCGNPIILWCVFFAVEHVEDDIDLTDASLERPPLLLLYYTRWCRGIILFPCSWSILPNHFELWPLSYGEWWSSELQWTRLKLCMVLLEYWGTWCWWY